MSRRMSCAITVDAVRARTKTETRRHVGSWRTLTTGDRLTLNPIGAPARSSAA